MKDTLIGVGSGIAGGVIKYATINEVQVTFSHKLLESSVIAFVCGVAGMIGKEAYNWIKKRVKKRK